MQQSSLVQVYTLYMRYFYNLFFATIKCPKKPKNTTRAHKMTTYGHFCPTFRYRSRGGCAPPEMFFRERFYEQFHTFLPYVSQIVPPSSARPTLRPSLLFRNVRLRVYRLIVFSNWPAVKKEQVLTQKQEAISF